MFDGVKEPWLGAGDIDAKPTSSFRLAPRDPDTGVGAANWVAEEVEDVEVGGGSVWMGG